jgi:hypothetical protein
MYFFMELIHMFILLALPLAFAIMIGAAIIAIAKKAVYLPKITFSLFAAVVACNKISIIASNGLLNYLVWCGIFIGACFLLCFLPRVNYSFLFLCNSFISYFIVEIAVLISFSIFLKQQEPIIYGEIIIKVVCFIISVITLKEQIEASINNKSFQNKFLIVIERIIASLIYAVALFILICTAMNGLWSFPVAVNIIAFVLFFVVAYLFDMFFFKDITESIQIPRKTAMPNSYVPEFEEDTPHNYLFDDDSFERSCFETELAIDEYIRESEESAEQWHHDWMDRAYYDD